MKILLIFPPLVTPYKPHLGLPSLCAYLKSKGICVVQKDFNVEAYNLLLSEDYLYKLQKKMELAFLFLDSKEKLAPGLNKNIIVNSIKQNQTLATSLKT